MAHAFTLTTSEPGVAFDRHGERMAGYVGDVRRCSRCGVLEAPVRTELLGRVAFLSSRGTTPGHLVEGAHARCEAVPT